jgi:alcohol dehydrogenase YqhD (iron-dependent ADH family)
MQNFTYQNATKIIFGKGTEDTVGAEVKKCGKKVLLHYGSGSIKKSGLYDKVIKSLKSAGVDFIELGGVKPNPRISLVREGIDLCRKNGVDFILIVGGGSAIDSAKGIAAGVNYNGDVWDLYMRKGTATTALPLGVILTIPAAGSETSQFSVVTNEDGWLKRDIGYEFIRPQFAILNPELPFTLPAYQAAAGATDIMAHLMERYFTNVRNVEFSDRLIEGSLVTMINNVPKILKNPQDYDAWAEVMWTGTQAHSDLLGMGRIGDWASHGIEHEISAIYDIAHGAGLAIIFPAWMKYVMKHDIDIFVQFAVRVFKVEQDFHNPEATALAGITKLEDFLRSIGMPVRFSDAGLSDERFEEMADKCTSGDTQKAGNFVQLGKDDVYKIYQLAK